MIQGKVYSVRRQKAGGEVLLSASTGATLLTLLDASEFDEDGGQVSIGGTVYGYTSADMDNDTLTLATGLSSPVAEGDLILLSPEAEYMEAIVMLDEEASISVRVPHTMNVVLAEGERDDEQAETVSIAIENGQYVISDVIGRAAVIDADNTYLINMSEALIDDQERLGDALDANATAITAATGRLTTAEADIAAAKGRLTTAEADLSTLETNLGENSAAITAAEDAIAQAALDLQDARDDATAYTDAAKADAIAVADSAAYAANNITSTQITDGAITTPKIATDAITTDKINAEAVTSDKLLVNTALANKINANIANIIQANIGNLTVTGDTHLNNLVAQRIAADSAQYITLTVEQLTATGTSTLNSVVAQTIATEIADIVQANIGNLTVTGDAHLNTVTAQRIGADVGSYVQLTVDQLLAGNLDVVMNVTSGGAIIAGNPSGARAQMDADGLRLHVAAPNGTIYPAVNMTTEDTSFSVVQPGGSRLGGIGSDGSVLGTTVTSKGDVNVMGTPLLGRFGGGEQRGWMDNLPRGVLDLKTSGTHGSTVSAEARGISARAKVKAGRRYRVVGMFMGHTSVAGGVVRLRLRYTYDGTLPTTSSPYTGMAPLFQGYSPTVEMGGTVEGFLMPETDATLTLLMTYQPLNQSELTKRWSQVYIEDVGLAGTEVGGEDGATPKTLYTTEWKATASRNYTKSGATVANQDGQINQWYWHASPTDYKPAAWIYGGGALVASDTNEMGKTLAQALNGATIERVQVYIKNKMWYNDDSAPMVFGTLAGTTLPSTKAIDATHRVANLGSGEGSWYDLPTSWFTNGANTGVTLGDKDGSTTLGGGTTPLQSGVFDGINDDEPPLLRVTYSR